MPGQRFILRSILAGLLALPLAGCGVIPMIAQQTTAAALAPFTTAARVVGTDLQIVGRGLSAMVGPTAPGYRQVTMPMARTRAMAPSARAQPRAVSYQPPRRPSPGNGNVRAEKAPSAEKAAAHDDSAGLEILPAALLARLTPDQAGLHRAAQSEAVTAAVGETIFWHLEGREGTVMAESENLMGGFTCRRFVDTLALEDFFEKSSAMACRADSGNWTQSF